jgi:hypothetical protein
MNRWSFEFASLRASRLEPKAGEYYGNVRSIHAMVVGMADLISTDRHHLSHYSKI